MDQSQRVCVCVCVCVCSASELPLLGERLGRYHRNGVNIEGRDSTSRVPPGRHGDVDKQTEESRFIHKWFTSPRVAAATFSAESGLSGPAPTGPAPTALRSCDCRVDGHNLIS